MVYNEFVVCLEDVIFCCMSIVFMGGVNVEVFDEIVDVFVLFFGWDSVCYDVELEQICLLLNERYGFYILFCVCD